MDNGTADNCGLQARPYVGKNRYHSALCFNYCRPGTVSCISGIQFAACVLLETYRGNSWYLFIVYMPLMGLGGGLEEIGWRDILQQLMEERFPFLTAAGLEGIL